MGYFKDAKKGDKVYGMIFGKGEISDIYQNSFYSIMVSFENGYEVPYTEDGVPSWGNFTEQTMFYREDIDLSNEDFSPLQEVLTPKDIVNLRSKGHLEVRLPSGIWGDVKQADSMYVEDLLENKKYYLFRKSKS